MVLDARLVSTQMSEAAEMPPRGRTFRDIPWRRVLIRVCYIVLLATIAGKILDSSAHFVEEGKSRAGFGQGMLHGALMPCAMPHLMVGRDVIIYAGNNNGRPYKLGYTVGVNSCGAVFFGFAFWRLNRWRKGAPPPPGVRKGAT